MSNYKYETNFNILVKNAMQDIDKMEKPIIQFCGPISTGGFGNSNENILIIKDIIEKTKNKISVFNQLKYEKKFDEILKKHKGYDYPILELFYKPILDSKKIDALFFIPLWETSVGSKWEFEYAKKIGLKTIELEDLQIGRIINQYSLIR